MGRVIHRTALALGVVAVAGALLLHATLAEVMVRHDISGALLSANGWTQLEALALGLTFLLVRALLFLLVPGAAIVATAWLASHAVRRLTPRRASSGPGPEEAARGGVSGGRSGPTR